ncbi:hypothetical protein [Bacillus sp. V59.32b]|uniref:hypothetical protein n=1 Tax=Bacillus sp. V59.32b TaxID=1758642 RepID=UPI000E3DF9F8|nr:hypothetical protein [Bacillus sp. V59.32b]RFU70011.1 hypothetical protein D0463_00620 [Bacillus sp. V59.32b]
MLLNKIAETRKTFEEYNKVYTDLQNVKKINSFSQYAKQELKKCKDILESYRALNQMDDDIFPKRSMGYELKQLEGLFNYDLAKLNRDEVSSFQRTLKKLDDHWKMRWTVYVQNKNQDLIGLLERLKNIVSNPQEIEQLIMYLKQFETVWPVSSAKLSRYHEYLAQANKVVSDMNASQGVQEFIGKVAANNATIEDLNDEVISWLREQQLTNKLFIKFK